MTQMINPHQPQPTSLSALARSLIKNRQLIYQMTRREIIGRYKGSVFGLAWSFFNPIVMLVIYTFVFSVVFKARWGVSGADSKTEFALILFVGLIVFNLFAETINRAPGLILSNVNYVKKVVFPLEILIVINFGTAFFHAFISFLVILIAFFLISGFINWTVIFLPIVIFPYVLLILGISWFIASLGVFVRDIGQSIGMVTMLLMFLSPVLYPITAVPKKFQTWILINPVSFMVEQARAVMVFGELPDWFGLSLYFVFSILMLMIGFSWFQKTRKGFADVI